jgi:hypothetical protein
VSGDAAGLQVPVYYKQQVRRRTSGAIIVRPSNNSMPAGSGAGAGGGAATVNPIVDRFGAGEGASPAAKAAGRPSGSRNVKRIAAGNHPDENKPTDGQHKSIRGGSFSQPVHTV